MRTLIFIKLEISGPQLIPRQLAGQTCLRTQWLWSIECCCFNWIVNIANQENQHEFGFLVSLEIWVVTELLPGSSHTRPASLTPCHLPHPEPSGSHGGSASLLSCAHWVSMCLRVNVYFNLNLPGLSGQHRFCCFLSLLLHLKRSRRWKMRTSRSRNAQTELPKFRYVSHIYV